MKVWVFFFFFSNLWVVLLQSLHMEDVLIVRLKKMKDGDFIKMCCKRFCSFLHYKTKNKVFVTIQRNPILFECANNIIVYSSNQDIFHVVTTIQVQFDRIIEFLDVRNKKQKLIYFWSPMFEIVEVEQEQQYIYEPSAFFYKKKKKSKSLKKKTPPTDESFIWKQCEEERIKCKQELMNCMNKQEKEKIPQKYVLCNTQTNPKNNMLINHKIKNVLSNVDLSKEIFTHFLNEDKRKKQMNEFSVSEENTCTTKGFNSSLQMNLSIIEKFSLLFKKIYNTEVVKKISTNPILLLFLINHTNNTNSIQNKWEIISKEIVDKWNYVKELCKRKKMCHCFIKNENKRFLWMFLFIILIMIVFLFAVIKRKILKKQKRNESDDSISYIESNFMKSQRRNSYSQTKGSGRLAEIHVEYKNKIQTNVGSKIKDITDEDLINLIALNKAETIVICQP